MWETEKTFLAEIYRRCTADGVGVGSFDSGEKSVSRGGGAIATKPRLYNQP